MTQEDTTYTRGWNDAVEAAAKAAEGHYPSILRCKQTGNEQHVRMHVETQWCASIGKQIRGLRRK